MNSPNKSPLKRNLFGYVDNETEMSFKSIRKNNMSPLKPTNINEDLSKNKKFGF
jgi:hypothetical protein